MGRVKSNKPRRERPPAQAESEEPAINITKAAWAQAIVGDPDGAMPPEFRGRRADILDALETGGPEEVRTLVESWGLVWKVGSTGRITVDIPKPRT